jgi:Arc/MetJ-type ribon-helix-helix transcriptional regulator
LLKPVIRCYDDLTRNREDLMNVSLTPELEKFVEGRVESGLYNNASEVGREGLRAAQGTRRDPGEVA